MASDVVIKATRRDAPMCEGSERLDTPFAALQVVQAMAPRPDVRLTVRSCGACGGYHVIRQEKRRA
jgi:hypothetical protein